MQNRDGWSEDECKEWFPNRKVTARVTVCSETSYDLETVLLMKTGSWRQLRSRCLGFTWVFQKDGSGWTMLELSKRSLTEWDWTRAQEINWVYWDAVDRKWSFKIPNLQTVTLIFIKSEVLMMFLCSAPCFSEGGVTVMDSCKLGTNKSLRVVDLGPRTLVDGPSRRPTLN